MSLAWVFNRGWRVVHAALSALFLVSAVWAFFQPVSTFFALASVLGLLLLLQGIPRSRRASRCERCRRSGASGSSPGS